MRLLNRLLWTLALLIIFTFLILAVRLVSALIFAPLERILPANTANQLFWAVQGAVVAVPATRFFLMRRWIMLATLILAFLIALRVGPA